MQALGFIETKGLLAAIECADVMLKTSQVELVERTKVGGGLITITVKGEVSAVSAAVDAAVAATEKFGNGILVSHHVIARPDDELEHLIQLNDSEVTSSAQEDVSSSMLNDNVIPETTVEKIKSEDKSEEAPQAQVEENSIKSSQIKIAPAEEGTNLTKTSIDLLVQEKGLTYCVEFLQGQKLQDLRQLIAEYTSLGMTKQAIKNARKDVLIKKIETYYQSEK